MLSVLHISTADNLGGSARSAYRIHRGLRNLGHRSRMLVGWKATDDPDVGRIWPNGAWRILDRVVGEIGDQAGLQYLCLPSSLRLARHSWVQEADILQLYNTHGGYLNHTVLPRLAVGRPIVWRLSDMWAFTGHCAYSYDCERWKTGCGSCPILAEYPSLRRDTTALLWKLKQRIYRRCDLTVVAPSRWMASLVRESPLLGRFPIHVIPNGLDTEVFRPIPKTVAREVLGLKPDARVILFTGHSEEAPRKGASYFREAIERLLGNLPFEVTLLVMGASGGGWLDQVGCATRCVGTVTNDLLMSAIYSAADVFVLPTLADNSPNGVLEAMACGTPAAAFNVGGVPELVHHMETGYLAAYKDAADLARGIQLLLVDEGLRERLGRRCREVVDGEHSIELQARRFEALYRDILRKWKTGLPKRCHAVGTTMSSTGREALPGAKHNICTPTEPFPETQYGIVKRMQVIEAWVDQTKERIGRSRLSILDYGCGTGDHITFPLARAAHEVLGIDIHEPSILEARRRYALPNLTFRTADAQSLLSDGLSFDVIVCSEVLEHLDDPSGLLGIFRRLLRPGGALIITTPNGYGSFELLRRVQRALTRIGVHQRLRWVFKKSLQLARWGRQNKTPHLELPPGFLNQDSVHVQFFRLRSLEELFFESGFRVVARRARTFLCGPYVDSLFHLSPGRQVLLRVNNRLADRLPFSWAADWMFLLEPKEGLHP
jgi:glycosyltransferase involved in cell wall biosynthesis/2-polyprenyl-3-methyl-5-hydroxy-6-metoxy-1,4-benzoquinol methylase